MMDEVLRASLRAALDSRDDEQIRRTVRDLLGEGATTAQLGRVARELATEGNEGER